MSNFMVAINIDLEIDESDSSADMARVETYKTITIR
jgi:hypothetical protein